MGILKLLAADGFLSVNKYLAKKLGLDAAVLLAELATAHNYFESAGLLTEDGMFYETVERIEENTTLSKYQQAKAVSVLEEAGILESKKMGVPAKRYFKINDSMVVAVLDDKKSKNLTTGSQKTEPQEVKKLDRNNNRVKRKEVIIDIDSMVAKSTLSPAVKEKLMEFFEYRNEIKKPYKSERGIKSLITQVENQEQKHGSGPVIYVIETSIQNQWQGLFWDRIENRKAKELDGFYGMLQEWQNT